MYLNYTTFLVKYLNYCLLTSLYYIYDFNRIAMPFRVANHITNSWNENKRVQYSKDGHVSN